MNGDVYPNLGPDFPCSVWAENVTWRSRSVQCCTCSKLVHLKCSLQTFSRFRTLGSSHSWSFPPCFLPASFRDSTPTNTVSSSSDSSSLYTSAAQSGPSAPPPLLMQHLILAFKPLIPLPPTSYFLPLYPHYRLVLLAIFYTSCFLSPLTLLGFFNGILGVSELGALNFYTSFCLIPLTLLVSRNQTLINFPRFGSLDSLLCDLIAPTSGLAFFLLKTCTLAAASSFSSGRAYPSLNFLPPFFLCLTPTPSM